MTKVLVSDPIDQAGLDILGQVAQVDERIGLSPEELKSIIGEYDAPNDPFWDPGHSRCN